MDVHGGREVLAQAQVLGEEVVVDADVAAGVGPCRGGLRHAHALRGVEAGGVGDEGVEGAGGSGEARLHVEDPLAKARAVQEQAVVADQSSENGGDLDELVFESVARAICAGEQVHAVLAHLTHFVCIVLVWGVRGRIKFSIFHDAVTEDRRILVESLDNSRKIIYSVCSVSSVSVSNEVVCIHRCSSHGCRM